MDWGNGEEGERLAVKGLEPRAEGGCKAKDDRSTRACPTEARWQGNPGLYNSGTGTRRRSAPIAVPGRQELLYPQDAALDNIVCVDFGGIIKWARLRHEEPIKHHPRQIMALQEK
jgi:hypothetical protein